MSQNSSKIRFVSQYDYFCVHVSLRAWLLIFSPFDVHWICFVCLHQSLYVIYLPLTTKSAFQKKKSSSADLLISHLLILCKFHNQLYHTWDPEPSIVFHLLFILIAILFILDTIFHSFNYSTMSNINIELFSLHYTKINVGLQRPERLLKRFFCLRWACTLNNTQITLYWILNKHACIKGQQICIIYPVSPQYW